MPHDQNGRPDVSAERAAADRAFDDAIVRLDDALRRVAEAFAAPASADEAREAASLGALARFSTPDSDGPRRSLVAAARRLAAFWLKPQQRFNVALVGHLDEQRALRHAVVELTRSQVALLEFLRTIKPYVDTRDFADVLRAVADEQLKRSDALLAHDRRRETQIADLQDELAALRARLDEIQRARAKPARPVRGGAGSA
jgi:hypothetical protein